MLASPYPSNLLAILLTEVESIHHVVTECDDSSMANVKLHLSKNIGDVMKQSDAVWRMNFYHRGIG